MATANGAQSPSTLTTSLSHITGKRKRAAASEEVDENIPASRTNNAVSVEDQAAQLQDLLEDVLVVLKRYVAPC